MAAALPLARTAPAPAPRPRRLRFALVFTVVIAAVSLLPYLLAYLWTPPGHHFAGFFFIADDATTYLAKMREGADGSWLWNDPYTSEPHGGVFLFGFFLDGIIFLRILGAQCEDVGLTMITKQGQNHQREVARQTATDHGGVPQGGTVIFSEK